MAACPLQRPVPALTCPLLVELRDYSFPGWPTYHPCHGHFEIRCSRCLYIFKILYWHRDLGTFWGGGWPIFVYRVAFVV